MTINAQYRVNRKPEVLERLGLSKSTLANRINDQLLPPPISLGGRSVGWLEHEVIAVIQARAAGKTDEEIRFLIQSLVEERKIAA